MKSVKAEFPLLLCTPFPAPQRILSKRLDSLSPIAPFVQLLLMPIAARITGHSLLACVIIIVHEVLRPRNAELHVPDRETSSPAGGCFYPICQAFYLVSFHLSTGFPEFKELPHRIWRLCISFPSSRHLYQLARSQVAYSRRIFSHMFRFSSYSSTIREPQV